MPRLTDLVKTVEQMSSEELLELHRNIRTDRKIAKKVEIKRDKKKKTEAEKMREKIENMSLEEALAMLQKMGVQE